MRLLPFLLFAGCLHLAFAKTSVSPSPSLFTWMTPYDRSKFTDWDAVLKTIPPVCSLKRISVVLRHGTSSPSKSRIETARHVIANLKLTNWTAKLMQDEQQTLLQCGIDEQEFLAQDFYNLLTREIEVNETNNKITFSSTDLQRAIDSSKAFRSKLITLADNSSGDDGFDSINKSMYKIGENVVDTIRLRYFDNCDRYVKEMAKNEASIRPEFIDIRQTPLAVKTIKQMNERFFPDGPNQSLSITWDDAFALYYAAGYETAIDGSSLLKEAFTKDDLALFDFAEDLETYRKLGYGNLLSSQISCLLTNEIFNQPSPPPIAAFYFTPFEAIVPLFAAFGIFSDSNETFQANASMETIQRRKFKSSQATPFSANIAFLFFDCSDGGNNGEQQKFAVVVNGKMALGLTSLSEIAVSSPWIFNCDYNAVCNNNSNDEKSAAALKNPSPLSLSKPAGQTCCRVTVLSSSSTRATFNGSFCLIISLLFLIAS